MDLRQDILDTLGKTVYSAAGMALALTEKGYSNSQDSYLKVWKCLEDLAEEGVIRELRCYDVHPANQRSLLQTVGFVKV